jgi:putative transposase
MVRPLRIIYPDAVYHITNRGVNRQPIFFKEDDYLRFLDYLAQIHQRMNIIIHGYCLMSNHYHLEITTPKENISRSIQWINQSYASYVNIRYQRSGHLFQGRFKSVVIEAESHLAALTRYIHLNPVRAGIVSNPIEYPWSSYRAYMGVDQIDWLNTQITLARFGKSLTDQRKNYREFIEESRLHKENPLKDMVYGAILGSEKFIEKMQKRLKTKPEDREISQLNSARRTMSIEYIVKKISKKTGVTIKELKRKGSKNNYLREVAIYICFMNCNKTNREIGNYFGGIDPAAVSIVIRKIKNKLSIDKKLEIRIKLIKRELV